MRNIRQIVAALVLALFCAAPLMPCLQADAQSAMPTHACCHGMNMPCKAPAQGTCCKAAPQSTQAAALDAKTIEIRPVVMTVVNLSSDELTHQASVAAWIAQADDSPPQSPPRIISNLRI